MSNPAEEAPEDWLDEQEFYEYMQAYRHAPLTDQAVVVAQFEAVKRFIRGQVGKSVSQEKA